jgi:hypothetical protein
VALGVYVIVTVVAWPPEIDMVFVMVMGLTVAVAVAVNDDK